ncbi:tRNA (adenosine(37)-N6)-threonylcarbamoyltransferase complex transferase subunit TsaD [bacterium]|nr:tRNA (adenosine(37)-N6)-threonylcarbamoyltransferase complex transferase subunit TsaD [bacterium]MBU1066055.1 tRNA (adenosine(37)-N6)-threonylcarbamoyltransferase complex transferase subunit TsaD [bacterium]MBU1635947.1 tRNA (adenosine(37)-N6)-threonylcarbamoyltransferase complex transferase subunit TsaD [bacterium]MBU1875031.1 tRNA (adenosine(37)-N6)-threonylcarbamoyltransferase complex transferase subunit TsaD [bacterium]
MKILGIETSCDETSVAVLDDKTVLVNLVSSQLMHQQYGGVVPELASREHMRILDSLVTEALDKSQVELTDIDGIAVTRGPGLMGALLVGLSFAKGLAFATEKPLLGVNHVEGHIMANFLDHPELDYPFLCLLVSGGHTQIIFVKDFHDYTILGRSIDDAAGEAFDKAARILNLGYPGGPIVDRLARIGKPEFYHFPRANIKDNPTNFSFSGLKTALLYLVRQKGSEWAEKHKNDLCASYQEAIMDVLVTNTIETAIQRECRKLVLAGGVAANSRLRSRISEISMQYGISVYFPSLEYCTDNAAMISRTGRELYIRQLFSSSSISAVPNLTLENDF